MSKGRPVRRLWGWALSARVIVVRNRSVVARITDSVCDASSNKFKVQILAAAKENASKWQPWHVQRREMWNIEIHLVNQVSNVNISLQPKVKANDVEYQAKKLNKQTN